MEVKAARDVLYCKAGMEATIDRFCNPLYRGYESLQPFLASRSSV